MTVAYLTPYYPHGSHTFIRREIAGVEKHGIRVERFSIRKPHGLVDSADGAEAERTTILLGGRLERGLRLWGGHGPWLHWLDIGILAPIQLLVATAVIALARPLRFARALGLAIHFGWRSSRGVVRHLIYLAEGCLLLRLMHWRGVSHLHAHFGTNATTVALLARTLGGPPYSFTVHGPDEFDHAEADSLADKMAGATFVVAVSSFGRSQLYRWAARRDWDKIRVVHCGLDLDCPLPVSAPQQLGFRGDAVRLKTVPGQFPTAPRLVCVGRLAEQKGQLILLEALAKLAAAGMAFEAVLAGDGPLRPAIESEIRRLGLTGRVRITGWLSGADVRREIEAARGLVLPSFAEGLPVVIMEALALGRPVISTFVAGIPELVQDGVHGWLIPAGDVEALAGAIRELLTAPPERLAAMGKAGADRVAERHDAVREAGKLAALFTR
jgi:glycosyltransferase involved in cell wall biosynthesis